jgi:phospholipid/cholesterol/gamma-HCH transport system substrate-binding protein
MRRSIWPSLIKLTVYTVLTTMATGILVLVIVNGRTGPTTTYRAQFTDVSGLVPNDNVKIAGVLVGKVSAVEVVDRDTAEVSFVVDDEIALPADVEVVVKYQNLIGDRFLELERPEDATTTRLDPADTIPVSRTTPALDLTVLFGGFRPLFQALEPEQVNQFADEVLQTLQGQGGTIESLLASTASLTGTVADRDQVIGDLVTDLNAVLGTVSARDQELSSLILQLQRFVSGLSEDRQVIGSAIASLGSLTESVSGLLVDVRPPLRGTITELGGLARNLDAGKDTIEMELEALSELLGRVNRTASYGSWFQFYNCSVGGAITIGGERSILAPYQNTAARCSS